MLNTQGPLSLCKDNLYVNNQPPQCKSTRRKEISRLGRGEEELVIQNWKKKKTTQN